MMLAFINRERLLNQNFRRVVDRGMFLDCKWICLDKTETTLKGWPVSYTYEFIVIIDGKSHKITRRTYEENTLATAQRMVELFKKILYKRYVSTKS